MKQLERFRGCQLCLACLPFQWKARHSFSREADESISRNLELLPRKNKFLGCERLKFSVCNGSASLRLQEQTQKVSDRLNKRLIHSQRKSLELLLKACKDGPNRIPRVSAAASNSG